MSSLQMLLDMIGVDARTALLLLGCFSLAFSGLYYGFRFLKLGNQILGYEYLIVGCSSVNFLFYNATLYQPSYELMLYLDSFSRAFGFPVLGTLGFMVLNHKLQISSVSKVALFAVTLALTPLILYAEFFESVLAYFYLIMMYPFCLYMFYVAKRLFDIKQFGLGVFSIVTTLGNALIATIYDFYIIPGEETNVVFNFFFLALITWSVGFVAMYYAYVALHRAAEVSSRAKDDSLSGIALTDAG
jgi:hypothetical protein